MFIPLRKELEIAAKTFLACFTCKSKNFAEFKGVIINSLIMTLSTLKPAHYNEKFRSIRIEVFMGIHFFLPPVAARCLYENLEYEARW
jgi:hypothetical protein